MENFTYAQALKRAREKISLEEIGIEKTNQKNGNRKYIN